MSVKLFILCMLILFIAIIFFIKTKARLIVGLPILLCIVGIVTLYIFNTPFKRFVNVTFNSVDAHSCYDETDHYTLPLPKKTALSYRIGEKSATYYTSISKDEVIEFYASLEDAKLISKDNYEDTSSLILDYKGYDLRVFVSDEGNYRLLTVNSTGKAIKELEYTKQDNQIIYTNNEAGYRLIFPEWWEDWFRIFPDDDGSVSVHFYGKSKTGSVIYEDAGCVGLPMFFLLTQKSMDEGPYDSIRYVGSAKGENYYFATGTGYDLGVLKSVQNNPEQMTYLDYELDDKELELAKKDYDQATKMMDTIYYITDHLAENRFFEEIESSAN